MEITKREVAASITIIALWIAIGLVISGKIDEWHQDKTAEYDRAARITEQELFEHGMMRIPETGGDEIMDEIMEENKWWLITDYDTTKRIIHADMATKVLRNREDI